jgi:hypothetical protein
LRALQRAADGFEDEAGFHPTPSDSSARSPASPLFRDARIPLAQR